MKTQIVLLVWLFFAVTASTGITSASQDHDIASLVPQPKRLQLIAGEACNLPQELSVAELNDESWSEHLQVFGQHLERMTGGSHRLTKGEAKAAFLQIERDADLSAEAYRIVVTDKAIFLTASSLKGLAHGTATLLQLIGGAKKPTLPALLIEDEPEVSYRSFMIDMGRNPHSVQLLRETIDLLWYYKVDSLHLHLTDDQRIAFPSTAFPKLWDGKITLDEFQAIEAAAQIRGVTIIPELEVPGHSGLLLRNYPEVFGESATELAESEEALKGIKTLLDEMMAVFSSTPYIHIGGDEAFGVPEEAQRDLINKLHAYLKSKGKQTLVWEGPRPGTGDNKVNPEVIHINWRTINFPADQMVKEGYRVVNAAWDPLYVVDHYPRINFTMTSPQNIYEALRLEQFKHVNPGITTFANPIMVEPTDQLIGFCMPWWEGREENYFPQIVPRIIPFAEIGWQPSLERDYGDFAERVAVTESLRQAAFYPLRLNAEGWAIPSDGVFRDKMTVQLELGGEVLGGQAQIHYTLDGSEPGAESPRYSEPLSVADSLELRAAAFDAGQQIGHGIRQRFTRAEDSDNLAFGKPVTSSTPSAPPFSVERLTDGGTGNLEFYLGYPAQPDPLSVTIDLERIESVSRIDVYAYTISGSYEKYRVEVSKDGKRFEEVATRLEKPDEPTSLVSHKFDPREVRFVRIKSHGNLGYVFDSFSKLVEVQVYP